MTDPIDPQATDLLVEATIAIKAGNKKVACQKVTAALAVLDFYEFHRYLYVQAQDAQQQAFKEAQYEQIRQAAMQADVRSYARAAKPSTGTSTPDSFVGSSLFNSLIGKLR